MKRRKKSKIQNPEGNGKAAALFMPCLEETRQDNPLLLSTTVKSKISAWKTSGGLVIEPKILHNLKGAEEEPQSPGGHTSVTG